MSQSSAEQLDSSNSTAYTCGRWIEIPSGCGSRGHSRLLEDTDQLGTRVSQVEDELDFYKKLHSPENPGRLSPPGENGEAA
ncbi:hypothetical protein ACFL3B_06495 [Gemmatimonadota bacterium]